MNYLDRAKAIVKKTSLGTKRGSFLESNTPEEPFVGQVSERVAEDERNELTERSPATSPLVLERKDDLVRLRGIRGWVKVADLTPCRDCGGTRFAIGKGRLFCHRCLPPKIGEKVSGYIDVTQVR
ncbi:MAG: hypothetical protein JNM56_33050 [Planctomycetia bacterium]|nr:hypothetical protein [Planctomycetia bacterium]